MKNIAKLTSYGCYLDCDFVTAKYPEEETHIVGNVAEYVYDLEQKIADLEAKLAEKEDRINWLVEAEFNRKWAKKYVEMRRKEDPMLCLPDSDEVYEKYFELKQQLAEKDEEIMELASKVDLLESEKENLFRTLEEANEDYQDKISFCIEKLEKVKELLKSFDGNYNGSIDCCETDILNIIDNQINELKEGE